jgi:hypothetical protein
MVTEILKTYFDYLEKLCDNAETFLNSTEYNLLSDKDKDYVKSKYDKLIQEVYNVCDLIEVSNKPNYKKSNYKINFKLTLKK